MRFIFLCLFFLFALSGPGRAADDDTALYNDLRSRIRELSRAIRLSENRAVALDEHLQKAERNRQVLLQDIFQSRYHGAASLHYLLSTASYPPVLSLLQQRDDFLKGYYAYRASRSAHDYYQLALDRQISRKIMLDEKTAAIKNYRRERDILNLSIQASLERLALLQRSEETRTADLTAFQAEIGRLESRHDDLNEFIDSLIGKNTMPPLQAMPKDNEFVLPVSGTVQTLFGAKTPVGAPSSGITIKTRPQAVVVSPLSGRVLYAGDFNRLGNIVIIEHSNRLVSIFKGLGDIYVEAGFTVAQRDPIGILSQENREESHIGAMLYYELRYNNNPVDPLDKLSGL